MLQAGPRSELHWHMQFRTVGVKFARKLSSLIAKMLQSAGCVRQESEACISKL